MSRLTSHKSDDFEWGIVSEIQFWQTIFSSYPCGRWAHDLVVFQGVHKPKIFRFNNHFVANLQILNICKWLTVGIAVAKE